MGLLSQETMSLIVKANQLEGVLTSRGCGAMGADVFAVFVKEDSAEYIRNQIEEMDLKFVYVL
jgi:cell division GTPase FtsZ